MAQNLVIVESPAKAKTIEKFLGKDFVVRSSYGHIRDLPKKKISIDIENSFAPTYEISPDKKDVVRELKSELKKASRVWLATDEDREGEAIAWHLAETLGIPLKEKNRIVFHEITKPAILTALENPRKIDLSLVDAQQARRVLDRLVGYELSPVLWRKVRSGLSAGRVQSVAVRLIVEREREIESFQTKSQFRILAEFDLGDGKILKAELPEKFATDDRAKIFLQKLIGAEFIVSDLQTKPAKRSPAPPFTTSTLQQEASRKLGYSVSRTMVLAQKLYEEGKITYMRTDSVHLSDIAIAGASKEIEKEYGKEFVKNRQFQTKTAGAQEAHEAIRPTDFSVHSLKNDKSGGAKLYELIWKRAIASQMAEAELLKTTAEISVSTVSEKFYAEGEVLKFEGFLSVYLEGKDDEEDQESSKVLPPLKVGQTLNLGGILARESFSRHPSRYTEASLVKKLEEMGIGRPSTYAPTISIIQDRGYVEKRDKEGQERILRVFVLKNGKILDRNEKEVFGAEKGKLFPTDIGEVVTDFLVKYFSAIVDYGFTAKVEEEFDVIAEGKKKWPDMIRSFYLPFHKTIEDSASISRDEATQVRELGKDPATGKSIFAKIGRYGPMVQLGETDSEEKPVFAPLLPGQKLDTLTLNEALESLRFPKHLGHAPSGELVSVQVGRFGPYLKIGKENVSLPKDQVLTITLSEALRLLELKKEADAKKVIFDFSSDGIRVLRGPFGPYITNGKKNVRVPKSQSPEELTLDICKDLLENAPEKKKFFRKRKTSS